MKLKITSHLPVSLIENANCTFSRFTTKIFNT